MSALTSVDGKSKPFDEYEIHCKIMALSALIGYSGILENVVLSENECNGIGLILSDIAYEIDPSQRPGSR